MKRHILLRKIAGGALHNVAFRDMLALMEGLGFRLSRVAGSHHIFVHPEVPEPVNLQRVRGEAKPYQIRQVLLMVERYNLRLEDES
jgi:predicted RNA binding protein YcfA (HicA-like mRNA interferase family)